MRSADTSDTPMVLGVLAVKVNVYDGWSATSTDTPRVFVPPETDGVDREVSGTDADTPSALVTTSVTVGWVPPATAHDVMARMRYIPGTCVLATPRTLDMFEA